MNNLGGGRRLNFLSKLTEEGVYIKKFKINIKIFLGALVTFGLA